MKIVTKLALSSLAFTCLNSVAAPVEYDTTDAHIVVIRPMDQWNPDESAMIKLDKEYFDNEYLAEYFTATQERISLNSDTSFATMFRNKYPEKKYAIWRMSVLVNAPTSIDPGQMRNLIGAQNRFNDLSVISQGNPKTLPKRVSTAHFWSGVASLATIGAAGWLGGGNFAAAVAGSGLPNQIGEIPLNSQKAIIGVKTKNIDYSKFKTVEIRTTDVTGTIRGRVPGQIIIAYKTEKTQAAEDEALALAIGSTLGFDTTKEATLAARAADLADRQAIWDKCVADGKCKNEE